MRRPAPSVLLAATVVQALAALFFIVEATMEVAAAAWSLPVAIELAVTLAFAAGVLLSGIVLRRWLAAIRKDARTLAMACSSQDEVFAACFAEWGLSPSERDVAILALKGCDAAQIAALRGSAPSAVRVQLASVYQKAGVSSRSGLASAVISGLVAEPEPPSWRARFAESVVAAHRKHAQHPIRLEQRL